MKKILIYLFSSVCFGVVILFLLDLYTDKSSILEDHLKSGFISELVLEGGENNLLKGIVDDDSGFAEFSINTKSCSDDIEKIKSQASNNDWRIIVIDHNKIKLSKVVEQKSANNLTINALLFCAESVGAGVLKYEFKII